MRAKAEALHYAAERFQSSRSFVLEAIQANAEALRYVAGNFQSDKTFVIEAVKANVQALRCVTDGGRARSCRCALDHGEDSQADA